MSRRALAAVAAGLVVAGAAVAADGLRAVEGNGVSLRVAADWVRVVRAADWRLTNPRTLLVVGTHGVRPVESECQVASYRIPAEGAAVVVIGWKSKLAVSYLGGRESLVARDLERGYFECFEGRGIAAQVDLEGRTYQINVMVGDRAERSTILEALATARSLAVAD